MTDISLAQLHPIAAVPDLAHARRLAIKAETTAAAAKAWAAIVHSRLCRPKPMDAAAVDVARDNCKTMATEADELRKAAVALEAALLPADDVHSIGGKHAAS
jgi:hypothetical protein